MRYLYVDESYQQSHYYVGGVLVDERQKDALFTNLETVAVSVKARNGWDYLPEWHGHELLHGQGCWEPLKPHLGARISICQRALFAIRNAGARVYVEGVDVNRLHSRYSYPDPPHEVVLRHLLERVNEYCRNIGERCTITADMVPQQQGYEQAIHGFTKAGTPGYRGQVLYCIDGNINWVDSRDSYGVQAADMAVYITRRFREEKHASKQSQRATKRLYKAIEPAIVRERKWIP